MGFDGPGDIIGHGFGLLGVARRERFHEREGRLRSDRGNPTCRRRLRGQLSEFVGQTDGRNEVYAPLGRGHSLAENSFAGKLCGHDRRRLIDDAFPEIKFKCETESA